MTKASGETTSRDDSSSVSSATETGELKSLDVKELEGGSSELPESEHPHNWSTRKKYTAILVLSLGELIV